MRNTISTRGNNSRDAINVYFLKIRGIISSVESDTYVNAHVILNYVYLNTRWHQILLVMQYNPKSGIQ